MNVPFVDLRAQYLSIQTEIDAALSGILESTTFIGGLPVASFEREFAKFSGVNHCVGVGNGTDAIYAVLRCLGVGPGDEVITVANSWISTSETISQTGARPVFVDVDEFFHVDLPSIRARIGPKTKAIVPVHLYGQPAAIAEIAQLCREEGLALVEDCAQAHGATYEGKPIGTFGVAGTFSFYPGKNLGAYGDAGAVVTSSEDLADRVRMFCNHGALKKHHHEIEGINSRLDSIQAAILSAKLRHLGGWTESRRRVASWYTEQLDDLDAIDLPKTRPGAEPVYHLFVIKSPERESLKEFLSLAGVSTQIHYPTALPLLPAYTYLGHQAADFPVAAANQDQILSLPMYAELGQDLVEYVCDRIREFVSAGARIRA